MTRQFRPKQCPTCRYYNDSGACMNSHTYTMPGDLAMQKYTGWSVLKGETNRHCSRFFNSEQKKRRDKMKRYLVIDNKGIIHESDSLELAEKEFIDTDSFDGDLILVQEINRKH